MEKRRFCKLQNVGQMHIRPNSQKFSQKVKQNICNQTKRQNFHNENAKLPCSEAFSDYVSICSSGVLYFAVCCMPLCYL